MTRLGGTDSVSTWRLSVGAALVSGGVLTAALGLAKVASALFAGVGVAPDLASWLGLAAAGVLVPLALLAGGHVLGTPAPYGRGLTVGAGLAVAGVPLVLLAGPPTAGTGPTVLLAALPYAAGVVLALWCLVASAAAPQPRATPAIRTTPSTTESRPSAADGGEDDDLSFPLEDDR